MNSADASSPLLKVQEQRRQRVCAEAYVSAKSATNQASDTPHRFQPSVIGQLYQQGSARIRFPNVEKGPLHAVLLNTAGGLTGADRIQWRADALEQSHLCISTAACEKIYRSHGPDAIQTTQLEIGKHARLEWLPQESILFNGACLNRSMKVQLDNHAEALLVESLVFGRQAMNESINQLRIRDSWRIYRCQKLIHAEELYLDINKYSNARAQCMLHQYSAMSTIVYVCNEHNERMSALKDPDTLNRRIWV